MAQPRTDPDSYPALMQTLENQETEVVRLCMKYMEENSTFTWANIFGWAICGRAAALSSGFRSMVVQKNPLCAIPMVRMQMDNVLRLYAGFFSDDSQDFSRKVLSGERIDRMKSRDDHKMTDKWLVNKLATKNPWMTEVYETTSGFVHLSGRHITHLLREVNAGKFTLRIGPGDPERTPDQFEEMLRCMRHLNDILIFAVDDWLARMCSPDGEVMPHSDPGKT